MELWSSATFLPSVVAAGWRQVEAVAVVPRADLGSRQVEAEEVEAEAEEEVAAAAAAVAVDPQP